MNKFSAQCAHRHLATWLTFGLILLWAPPLGAQQREQGAKDIFYNPGSGAASRPSDKPKSAQGRILTTKKASGIHYWLELDGGGKVTDDHVFQTGDRVKLHLRSNVDGYLTLLAYDSSGNSQVIFPPVGASNQVKAYALYALPGWLTFRPPPQDETLLIFFSQSPTDTPPQRRGSMLAEQSAKEDEAEGGKDLAFEVEKKNPDKLGDYVAHRRGGAITKEIRLKHRAR